MSLHVQVGGLGRIAKRPLIVEDSPYAPGCCNTFAGAAYNYVLLDWRGTGQSGGVLNSTGGRDQKDLSQFLGWACKQPWSNGRIGLYGFSASAIVAYNSMHLPMPCVKAAAMMSGTVDLYRDLLYIGGVNNTIPGLVVEAGIGGPWLADQFQDFQPEDISNGFDSYVGAPLAVNNHKTFDAYWRDRTFKGNHDKIPIFADVGFYDVESRGAFEAYKANRAYGSHLLVIGAHDGWPRNTPGPFPQYTRWFDHYVRGIKNGIDREPRVSLYMSNGSHKSFTNGSFVHRNANDWPMPGTRYRRYFLTQSNDLSPRPEPQVQTVKPYVSVPTDTFATDPHTTATISGNFGDLEEALTDTRLAEPTSLGFETAAFSAPVEMVGPASLDVFLASAAPTTDVTAVLSDVWPDGSTHPVARGLLKTSFPGVDRARSVVDAVTHEIVQPYNDFTHEKRADALQMREYHVEILPIGNRFGKGHKLRLDITGAPVSTFGSPPGVNLVSVGGKTPSRLVVPIV